MKDKRGRAEYWLNRWAFLVRLDLPDLGYPHLSPEQEKIRGIDTRDIEMTEYDEEVKAIVDSMGDKQRRMTRMRWVYRDPVAVIANKEGLSIDGVRWRLDAIREYVARHAGL